MNKIRATALFALLICLFGFNIYGQRREITQEEFIKIYSKAQEDSAKLSRRITYENRVPANGELQLRLITKGTEEYLPPDKSHIIVELYPSSNEVLTNNITIDETIIIKDIQYNRRWFVKNGERIEADNGAWRTMVITEPRKFSGIPTPDLKPYVKYYLTEHMQLDDKTANLLEVVSEQRLQLKDYKTQELKETITTYKHNIWMSNDGLLLKDERDAYRNNGEREEKITYVVTTYEYNPNIKIEAPITETKPNEIKQTPQ